MSGLKLIAAGICGSALTLAVGSLAQSPKRQPVAECPNTAMLIDISQEIGKLPEIQAQLAGIAADQKSTLQWAQYASGDLNMVKREVDSMSIALDMRRR